MEYSGNVYLERIRDMFLFCCYTGLRYSDGIALEKKNIRVGDHGGLFVEIPLMQKVDMPVYLPLHILFDGKPQQIAMKYQDNDSLYLFGKPVTNQYFNRELKTIACDAGLNIKLTSHVARHTFGSLLAEIKPDPYLIMELMGHNSLTTSMIYIHNSRERVNRQLEGLKWDK